MDPLQEYTSRRNCLQADELLLKRQFIKIGNWRLLLAIVALALGWLSFGAHKTPASLLFLPAGAFAVLVVSHQRVIRKRVLAGRALAYYDKALSRVQDRWM